MRKALAVIAAGIMLAIGLAASPAQAGDYTPCSGPQSGICDSDTIGLAIPYNAKVGQCTTFKWDSWLYQSVTASNVQADGSHDPAWQGDKVLHNGQQQICFNVVGTDRYTFHYNNAMTADTNAGQSESYTYLVHVTAGKARGPVWCC